MHSFITKGSVNIYGSEELARHEDWGLAKKMKSFFEFVRNLPIFRFFEFFDFQ